MHSYIFMYFCIKEVMNMLNPSKLLLGLPGIISMSEKERQPMKADGMLEKILDRKKKERLENRIHFSSYWGTYSRILSLPDENELGEYIELNLTPINGLARNGTQVSLSEREYQENIWKKEIIPGIIRNHVTCRSERDRDMKDLPDHLRKMMEGYLDENQIEWLLTFDFLGAIHIPFLKTKHNPCGGGSCWENFKK